MASDSFIVKPQAIIQDQRLTPLEQDYLCLIAALQKADGCTASNQFFADFFGVSRPRAVKVISSLKSKGFIKTVEEKHGKKTIERSIEIIDCNSVKSLLSNSVKSLPTNPDLIVTKTTFDSVKMGKPIIKEIIYNTYAQSDFVFILKTGENWLLPAGKFEEYQTVYPKADVKGELRKAAQWLRDNPNRRKTGAGMLKFLNGWLARCKPSEQSPFENHVTEELAEELINEIYTPDELAAARAANR